MPPRFDPTRFRASPRGFSLIEMLVVVAIISVLATIGLPLAELAHKRAKEEELRAALRDIRTALDAYKRATDEGHIVRRVGEAGYPATLEALVQGVPDAQSPKGEKLIFMRRLPRDPFGATDNNSGASAASTWGLRGYGSPAEEPRPGPEIYDVYSKSTESGMNGVPYKQW